MFVLSNFFFLCFYICLAPFQLVLKMGEDTKDILGTIRRNLNMNWHMMVS